MDTFRDQTFSYGDRTSYLSDFEDTRRELPGSSYAPPITNKRLNIVEPKSKAKNVRSTLGTYSVQELSDDELRTLFAHLSKKWKRETAHISMTLDIMSHPAYMQIIGLGTRVLPLILRDLQETHSHWFDALAAITRTSPTKVMESGNISTMVSFWLKWAHRKKIVF